MISSSIETDAGATFRRRKPLHGAQSMRSISRIGTGRQFQDMPRDGTGHVVENTDSGNAYGLRIICTDGADNAMITDSKFHCRTLADLWRHSAAIVRWYKSDARIALAETRDHVIWLSEVILQRTRVNRASTSIVSP